MAHPTPARTTTRRTGRRPGASSTREEILKAAERLFAERGYEGATIRAIAADAGVDAALVIHFFANKATLLGEAVQWPFDPDVEVPKLLIDGRRHAGGHLVELFVRIWDQEGTRNPVLTLLRAATTEPAAAEMMHEFLRDRLLAPLMRQLKADHADLRANLVASQLVGLGIARYVLGFEPLASAEAADVVAWISPTVQRYLSGKLKR
jgi:AcrR family transcriptional regulator